MRVAYLIDKESVGGGMEYIRRQMTAHPNDESRVFTADHGMCTAAKVNAWGAEVVHVNHLRALVQLFRNPFVRPRGKVVFTIHGIHLRKYDFLPQTARNRMKRRLRLLLEKWLYQQCDELIALTETDATDSRKLYGAKLPVHVEPNIVSAGDFKPWEELRYGMDEFAFVCIARFDFQKGQDILLGAVARVREALRAAGRRVLFVGDGVTLPEMKGLSEKLQVADLVEFAGEIPAAGVYMTCGSVLVAPSRWEGMPYLLLEAVARRRPVIASDCPGNRDVLKGYAGAKLFDVEDVAGLAALMQEAL